MIFAIVKKNQKSSALIFTQHKKNKKTIVVKNMLFTQNVSYATPGLFIKSNFYNKHVES